MSRSRGGSSGGGSSSITFGSYDYDPYTAGTPRSPASRGRNTAAASSSGGGSSSISFGGPDSPATPFSRSERRSSRVDPNRTSSEPQRIGAESSPKAHRRQSSGGGNSSIEFGSDGSAYQPSPRAHAAASRELGGRPRTAPEAKVDLGRSGLTRSGGGSSSISFGVEPTPFSAAQDQRHQGSPRERDEAPRQGTPRGRRDANARRDEGRHDDDERSSRASQRRSSGGGRSSISLGSDDTAYNAAVRSPTARPARGDPNARTPPPMQRWAAGGDRSRSSGGGSSSISFGAEDSPFSGAQPRGARSQHRSTHSGGGDEWASADYGRVEAGSTPERATTPKGHQRRSSGGGSSSISFGEESSPYGDERPRDGAARSSPHAAAGGGRHRHADRDAQLCVGVINDPPPSQAEAGREQPGALSRAQPKAYRRRSSGGGSSEVSFGSAGSRFAAAAAPRRAELGRPEPAASGRARNVSSQVCFGVIDDVPRRPPRSPMPARAKPGLARGEAEGAAGRSSPQGSRTPHGHQSQSQIALGDGEATQWQRKSEVPTAHGRGSPGHGAHKSAVRGIEGYVPSGSGGLMSSSSELGGPQVGGRSSTRLHAPPGGRSSISFG